MAKIGQTAGIKNGNYKHGLNRHKLHGVHNQMISRCYNPNHTRYKDYGGRGITICDEWRQNFLSFYNWAINNGWCLGLEIDRENNEGNYEPSNCRLVTRTINQRNKRSCIIIEYKGKSQTLAEWAVELNLNAFMLYTRARREKLVAPELFERPSRYSRGKYLK